MDIVIIGPSGSGKSTLANVLAGLDGVGGSSVYRPTVVCRIIDVEDPICGIIRLYDTSGDPNFCEVLPSLCENPDALIIVHPHDGNLVTASNHKCFTAFRNLIPDRCAFVFFNPLDDANEPPDIPNLGRLGTVSFLFSPSRYSKCRSDIFEWINTLPVYSSFRSMHCTKIGLLIVTVSESV